MVSLLEFLDNAGEALAKRVVEMDFNDNVRLTFHVDTQVREGVEELVRQGVNTGALVYVPPRDSDGRLRGSFVGKHFRLSHLLATRYGLPIHLTPSVALSRLLPSSLTLGDAKRPVRQSADPKKDQGALFADESPAHVPPGESR
jgi:hypothetical protein